MSPISPARVAANYGVAAGIYAIVAVYIVRTWFPPSDAWLIGAGAMAISFLAFWPTWFDSGIERWTRRFSRRMRGVALATPIAAIVSAGIVWMVPSYLTWQDDLHRQKLQRAGRAPQEIEVEVAALHQRPTDFLAAGAVAAFVPGLIGAVLTTTVGAAAAGRRVRATSG